MLYQLATAALFLLCVSADDEEKEAVFTLTSDNFDEFVSSHSRVLVEFYAPWCGHCKQLAPEYEAAAQQLHNDPDLDVVLAKVDATEEKDLGSRYGVRGFPTLKYFTGDVDSPSDYGGGRSKDTIVSWLSKRALPAVSEFTSGDEVNAFREKNRLLLVGCFAENNEEFASTCDVMRESVACARVSDASVCGDSSVVFYRQFSEPDATEVPFTGDVTKDALTDFVNKNRFPLVDQIGPENYKDYMDRGLPLVWIALDGENEEQLNTVVSAVTDAANANAGVLSFTWIDNNKYAQHVGNLGLSSVPGLIVVDGSSKYIFDGDVTNREEVSAWFVRYNNNEIERFLKTQPVPETNDEDVFVLVGSAFDEVVGGEQAVFLEFYAPWCGHCKKLAPEYDRVGAAFKENDNVVIAKIDATENDTPEEIRGFPTLIFYPPNSKQGTKYEGGRTAEDIISWIQERTGGAAAEEETPEVKQEV